MGWWRSKELEWIQGKSGVMAEVLEAGEEAEAEVGVDLEAENASLC